VQVLESIEKCNQVRVNFKNANLWKRWSSV